MTVAAGQPRRDQQEGLQAKQAHGNTPQSNTMCAFALIPGRAAFTTKTKQTVADPKPFPMVGPLSGGSLPALLPSVFPFQDNVLTLGTPFLSPHTTFTEPFLLHRTFPSPVPRGQHSCRHFAGSSTWHMHSLCYHTSCNTAPPCHAAAHEAYKKNPPFCCAPFFQQSPLLSASGRTLQLVPELCWFAVLVLSRAPSLPPHQTTQTTWFKRQLPFWFCRFFNFFFFNIFLPNACTCQLLFSCQPAHEGGWRRKHKSQPQPSTLCLADILSFLCWLQAG